MDLKEAIRKRRSVRIFKKTTVEKDKIERIIDAAQWAPSACNKQLWEFISVSTQDTKERIVREAGAAGFIRNAPIVIFILYPKDVNKEYDANIQSAAAAINNMLLAAYEEGLGSVWVAACGNRKILHRILAVPDRFLIVSAVCLGYAHSIPPPPPRRGLEELIHHETYQEKVCKRGYSFRDWAIKSVEDYREKGIRATSPFPAFFENLSGDDEFCKEIDFACRHINPDDKVLDVLSFSGNHILEIMKRKNLPCVYIHDVSEDIRYFLDERKQNLGITGKLNFSKGGLIKFSYALNEFDVVTCFKKVNMVPDPQGLLSEMERVLKAKGRMIISFWDAESPSGIYHCIRQRAMPDAVPLTNEGPVIPLGMRQLKRYLKGIGLKILSQSPVFSRTGYVLCRKP